MIDQIEQPPLLERPDEHEAGAADESYCWMPGNDDRECNGSCVAYDPSYEEDQRRTSCLALNAIRSGVLALNVMGAASKQSAQMQARRQPQPQPPEVKS